ncbi:Heme-degrading monooxygenase HmoA [Amycolatopsis pretoriensis]|uniref:Heme-degrading monooxygenase HmoA n=1 Tax=Amycolatopsis pretoriensis TaxID=218821 RepID=A0A1H5R1F8_9PSEU|nr:antibiotic biosynthesis monooxygenase family protein [Amycolatopsis pretoriensis]SEF32220.1 Heme-degrading monooxygenase HmoA [Amycolatopsis pretoriensis]
MVWEIARIDVRPGDEAAFEKAVGEAVPLFESAGGCHGVRLRRGVEQPQRYWLVVEWETVEDHTVRFRGSPGFARWRELVGGYFAAAPQVEHVNAVELP